MSPPSGSDRVQVVRELLQDGGIDRDLILRFLPITLFYCFPDARQCFYAIAGIKTGGIDGMPVPGAPGETVIR